MIERAHPDQVPFGTVTPGARADLVLREKNSLDDLATLRAPLGVMAGGRRYDRARLESLLSRAAQRYSEAAYPG